MQGPAQEKSIQTARVDPYRWSHKAIRTVLGRLLESAGRSDFGNIAAVRHFRGELESAVLLLATHARIEVQFIDALIAAHDAPLASEIQHDHVGLERDLHRVAGGLHHVEEALGWDGEGDAREARARGHALYLGLSRFVASYLLHISDEETRALPVLQRYVSDADLGAALATAEATSPPDEMARTSALVLASISRPERVEMVSSAAETTRQELRRIALLTLPDAEWRALEAALEGRDH